MDALATRLRPLRSWLAPALVLSCLFFLTDTAAAQQQPTLTSPAPYQLSTNSEQGPAHMPSLTMPRFELASGITLLAAAVPVAVVAGLLAGPPLFADCEDSSDPYCSERLDEKEERGRAVGIVTGLLFAGLGTVLTVHGALRIGRVKAQRRALLQPSAFNVLPAPGRAVAQVSWRF
ncbi:MAG: hypothetical protein QM778_22875 [Myxococcales bacterium]